VTETLGRPVAARPQLVIFDLDGTLTDSAQGIVSSFRHALGEVGAVVPDGDLASRIVGPPMHHRLREMGLGTDTDAAIAAYRADYSTRGWAMNRLFDGIAGLLTDLRAAGVRLAVATSKAEPTARRILRTSDSTSISRSSPAPASTAQGRPSPMWSRTHSPNYTPCPTVC
jgi:phosphoglycolate phosphatase